MRRICSLPHSPHAPCGHPLPLPRARDWCFGEDELLAGDLDYQDFKHLPPKDEAMVLRLLSAARKGERE